MILDAHQAQVAVSMVALHMGQAYPTYSLQVKNNPRQPKKTK